MGAFEEGQRAFRSGLRLTQNPYRPLRNPVKNQRWTQGWLDARNESRKK